MEIRPNQRRTKMAIIMICAVLTVEIFMLISDYMQYNLLVEVQNGGFVEPTAAENNDLRQQILGFIYLAVFITSIVTFINWFRRAFFNLEQRMEGRYLKFTNQEAGTSWFIPIVSLFKPYQVMREMFRKTEIYMGAQIKGYIPQTTPSLGWWWTFWIINNILGNLVFSMASKAETLDQLLDYTTMSMASAFIAIPLALLAILVIQNYSEKEVEMERISTQKSVEDQPEILPEILPES